MTQQELRSLPVGTIVDHKDYGVCEVTGHSLPFGVDLKILNPFGSCLGRKEFCETRHSAVSIVKPISHEEFEKEFQKSVKRAQRKYGHLS
jgi:hypothetical protein